MTKRFRKVQGFIQEIKPFTDGELLDLTEIENKLNELYEENEQLKSCFKASEESVEALRSINNNLEKENKQLKKENEKLLYEITEYKQAEYDNYNITDGLW